MSPDQDGCVVFELDSVSKRYRDGTVAVAELTLDLGADATTVLVGPPRSGRTTVLRLLNRMVEPTSGTIRWNGAPLAGTRRSQLRRRMGYVMSPDGLFPHRTVLDNVTTVPRLLGWTPGRTRSRALQLIEAVGLERRWADRFPAQLSAGRRQRVALARALAAEPPVLLLDEPFTAIDPADRDDLHGLLRGLTGTTVVMITDEIDEAVAVADQIVVLRAGAVVQVGTPAELLSAPADEQVARLLGRDRGYRSLSFTAASGLVVRKVRAVRDARLATPGEPTLVLGPAAEPLGWADRLSDRTLPLGAVFDPRTDTLRVALDAALSSPYGLAVAVDRATGRFVGVAGTDQITGRIRDERLDFARSFDPNRPAEPVPTVPAPVVAPGPDPDPVAVPGADDAAPVVAEPVPAPAIEPEPATEQSVAAADPEPVAPELEPAEEPAEEPADVGLGLLDPPAESDDAEEIFDQEHSVPLYDEGAWPTGDAGDPDDVHDVAPAEQELLQDTGRTSSRGGR